MKKVLLVSLALAVGMTGFAQKVVVKDSAKNASATAQRPSTERIIDGSAAQGIQFNMPNSMVRTPRSLDDFEEFNVMTTNYDLQSNSAIGNRIAVWPDGAASFVATWDHSGSTGFPDRGAGYNFYNPDDQSIYDEPEERQEPVKSGWPTIAACGDGEIMASHASGTNVYYRPTRGEGEWELVTNFPDVTWPRIVCSGPNDKYIHLAMADQVSEGGVNVNHLYYVRLTHEGDTWEVGDLMAMPLIDNAQGGEYNNTLGADDYVMAANGNDVAILIGSYTTDLFYVISHDNGETWEKQMVFEFPIEGMGAYDWENNPEGWPAILITSDNSHSITIDNNGVVHVAFGMFRWRPSDDSHYSYWPAYNYGIVYWNSNYTNEQGGHNIPLFGEWSQDQVLFPEFGDTISYALDVDRLDALCEAEGNNNLHFFGYVDENGNGTMDYDNILGATWHYRSLGLATLPSIAVDEFGNIMIAFSVWSETRVAELTNFSYRSTYITYKTNGEWYDDCINLAEDFLHMYEEQYSCTAAPKGFNGNFWLTYSGDEYQGLYLDISDTYPDSNHGELSENYVYAVKFLIPDWDGVDEHQAVNPMTSVRVYPNPAVDVLNIEVNASKASDMNISVFNLMGQKVMETNTNLSVGINRPSISTSDLSSGIYFVTVKADGFDSTMKFIVK